MVQTKGNECMVKLSFVKMSVPVCIQSHERSLSTHKQYINISNNSQLHEILHTVCYQMCVWVLCRTAVWARQQTSMSATADLCLHQQTVTSISK